MGKKGKGIDSGDYWIDYCIKHRPITESSDDDDIIHEFTGKIVYCREGLTKNPHITAGTIRGARIDLGECVNRHINSFNVIDGISGILCEAYCSVLDWKTGEFFEDLGIDLGSLLVVEEIRIAKKFRGKNLGLAGMIQTLNTMGADCSAAVIKPFPLQYSNRGGDDSKKFIEARAKLRKHWEKAGFEQVRKSDYYFINLHNVRPDAKDLITELEVEV